MCLAIPAQVKSLNGNRAEVDLMGNTRTVNINLTPEVQIGQYVLVHAGYAIGVVNEEEAHETIKLLEELYAAEQEG